MIFLHIYISHKEAHVVRREIFLRIFARSTIAAAWGVRSGPFRGGYDGFRDLIFFIFFCLFILKKSVISTKKKVIVDLQLEKSEIYITFSKSGGTAEIHVNYILW